MNTRVKLDLTYITLLLVALMPLLDVIYPAKLDDVSRAVPIIEKLLLVCALSLYFLKYSKWWWLRTPLGRSVTTLIVVHIIYLVLSSNNYPSDFFKLAKTLIWYLGFFFFLDLGWKQKLSERFIYWYLTIITGLIFVLVLHGVTNEVYFRSGRDYAASNFAYYLAFIFPYIFMFRNVPFRSVILLVVTIGVAVSMKRGTMLAYSLMIMYVMLFGNLKKIGGRQFAILFRLSLVVVLLLVFQEVILRNLGNYVYRFSDIFESTSIYGVGSGRGSLYLLPLERWVNADVFNIAFGFGFNSTPDFYPTTDRLSTTFYAHSDFVMLIHDYGVIGLVLLLAFF